MAGRHVVLRVLIRFTRAFVVSLTSKAAITLVTTGKLKHVAGPRNLRWALGWATFCGTFEAIQHLLQDMNVLCSRSGTAASAFLSSASFLILAPESRTGILSLLGVRACDVLCREGVRKKMIPRFGQPYVVLMGISSSVVLWAYLSNRSSLDASYLKFMLRHGNTSVNQLECLHHVCQKHPIPQQTIDTFNATHQTHLNPASPSLGCDVLHPGTRHCSQNLLASSLTILPISAQSYAQIYALGLVSPKTAKNPYRALKGYCTAVLRSAVFLSCFTCASWAVMCFQWRSYSVLTTHTVAALCVGPVLLLEKASRRSELALFVTSQGVEGLVRSLMPSLTTSSITPFLQTALFGVSMGALIRSARSTNEDLQPMYRKALRYLVTEPAETLL